MSGTRNNTSITQEKELKFPLNITEINNELTQSNLIQSGNRICYLGFYYVDGKVDKPSRKRHAYVIESSVYGSCVFSLTQEAFEKNSAAPYNSKAILNKNPNINEESISLRLEDLNNMNFQDFCRLRTTNSHYKKNKRKLDQEANTPSKVIKTDQINFDELNKQSEIENRIEFNKLPIIPNIQESDITPKMGKDFEKLIKNFMLFGETLQSNNTNTNNNVISTGANPTNLKKNG